MTAPQTPADLAWAGYRIEHGEIDDSPELQNRYWWTCIIRDSQALDVSEIDYQTPEAAINNAYETLVGDLWDETIVGYYGLDRSFQYSYEQQLDLVKGYIKDEMLHERMENLVRKLARWPAAHRQDGMLPLFAEAEAILKEIDG